MLGWRSSCQGSPRAHGTSPDQSDARSEDTCSNSACPPPGRGRQAEPISASLLQAPLNIILSLSVVPRAAGRVQ